MAKKENGSSTFRKNLYTAGLAFLFFVLIMVSFFGKNGLLDTYKAKQKKQELIERAEQLEAEKQELQKEIEELKKNPQTLEKKAREKLWLVKPEEIVVVKK
ncbi:MAG TPA: septum formation initiator family protein [Acidobacteriota bacterium]|nr:septum formation initiator family protein [Acidobacteriota bacterium]